MSIATPLTDLSKAGGLKKRPINWTDAWQTSFDMIKSKLVNVALLQAPDTSEPYRVETDASDIESVRCCCRRMIKAYGTLWLTNQGSCLRQKGTTVPKRGSSWEYSTRYALGDAFWKAAFTRCPLTIIHSSIYARSPSLLPVLYAG